MMRFKGLSVFVVGCVLLGGRIETVIAADITTGRYALNVVYFIPSDMEPVEGYSQRLSDLMLYTQQFYGSEMERNGFGKRSFGMRMKSKSLVDVVEIRGKEDKNAYQYDGGGSRAIREIDAFFDKNPALKGSQHTLVFMPSTTGDDYNPGGVPFYGMGRYCFVLDYKLFDIQYLGKDSREGRLLTKWFGGMAHELGHGLNLPHNMETVSNRKKYGTALMGSGNYTLGMKPTFLTQPSCAILSNCEVFSSGKGEFYRDSSKVDMKQLFIRFTDKTIDFAVDFSSTLPVQGVNVYIDNAPYGVGNTDYDAVSFFVVPKGNLVRGKIEMAELHNTKAGEFQVRMVYLHNNGTSTAKFYNFNWDKLVDLSWKEKPELSKSGWTVKASSEESDSKAQLMLDNDATTFWHSQWRRNRGAFPYELEFSLPGTKTVAGFSFQQRDSLHGAVKDVEISVKVGNTWQDLGRFTLAGTSDKQYLDLEKPLRISAFKMIALSNSSPNDPEIATMAEVGLY